MGGKVYELNGEEQKILELHCFELQAMTKSKIMKQDVIKQYTTEIEAYKTQQRDIISYMADTFGLTEVQVIAKVLAENRKDT